MPHRKWLQADQHDGIWAYHPKMPKMLGFEAAPRSLREHGSNTMHSTARIPLRIAVTHIFRKLSLGWIGDDTRIVYVDLKAVEKNYDVGHDEQSFEFT